MGEPAKKLEAAAAELWIVDEASGKSFALKDGFLIGRAVGDIQIIDPSVSSKHCIFYLKGRVLEIEDVGSRNGTFVDGKKIEPKTRLALMPGVRVSIGNRVFLISAGPQPEERATAVELASLFSQLEPDSIPSPPPNSWSSAAVPRFRGRQDVKPSASSVAASRFSNEPIALRQERPSGHFTGTITHTVPTTRPKTTASAATFNENAFALYAFVVLNCAAFGWAISQGADLMSPTVASLISMGGNLNGLTTGGQWWRLLTSTFAHSGVYHIASNMLALLFLGRPVALRLGTARFSSVYMLCGLFGAVASIAFNAPNVVSVGASGSVFGVIGALLALQVLGQASAGSVGRMGMITTANFVIRNLGLGVAGIDVAAHIGGLVAGFLLCLLMNALGGNRSDRRPMFVSIAAAVILVVCAGFVPHKEGAIVPTAFLEKFMQGMKAVAALKANYNQSAADLQGKRLSEADFATKLHDTYIPQLEAAILVFEGSKTTNEKEARALKAQLEGMKIWRSMMQELELLGQTHDMAHLGRMETFAKELKALEPEGDASFKALIAP